jgi:hypothetical protein
MPDHDDMMQMSFICEDEPGLEAIWLDKNGLEDFKARFAEFKPSIGKL